VLAHRACKTDQIFISQAMLGECAQLSALTPNLLEKKKKGRLK
jgi:hypothetical protein